MIEFVFQSTAQKVGGETISQVIELWTQTKPRVGFLLATCLAIKPVLDWNRAGVPPEYWTTDMLGFPQPEEDQHEEDAICGKTNCPFVPLGGSIRPISLDDYH